MLIWNDFYQITRLLGWPYACRSRRKGTACVFAEFHCFGIAVRGFKVNRQPYRFASGFQNAQTNAFVYAAEFVNNFGMDDVVSLEVRPSIIGGVNRLPSVKNSRPGHPRLCRLPGYLH